MKTNNVIILLRCIAANSCIRVAFDLAQERISNRDLHIILITMNKYINRYDEGIQPFFIEQSIDMDLSINY